METTTTSLSNMLLETVTKHLPPGSEWVPLASAGVAAAIGLLFMAKGAKLTPILAALAFAAFGGFGGAYASDHAGVVAALVVPPLAGSTKP